jgi:hypothetical protein
MATGLRGLKQDERTVTSVIFVTAMGDVHDEPRAEVGADYITADLS